jgi:hypothetical protein
LTIPKRYRPLLFFVAMLLTFDVAYSLLSTCQQPIYPSAAEQGGHQNYCTPFGGILFSFGILPLVHFLHTYEHELVAGFTIVLAFSTVALWLSTNKLWEATRDTAANQERDTHILQRAYISVEPAGIHAHHERWRELLRGEKGPLQSVPHVVINNSGNLPARKIKWTIEHKFNGERYLNHFPFESLTTKGEGTLPPGGKMRQGGKIINGGAGDGELRIQPERFLYVWGLVSYEDGFGTVRTTKFCHRYNCGNVEEVHGEKAADAGGKGPVIGLTIASQFARVHRYGNDAT